MLLADFGPCIPPGTYLGLKTKISHFIADLHQREQEQTVTNKKLNRTKRIPHKLFYAIDVIVDDLDLRAMSAVFSEVRSVGSALGSCIFLYALLTVRFCLSSSRRSLTSTWTQPLHSRTRTSIARRNFRTKPGGTTMITSRYVYTLQRRHVSFADPGTVLRRTGLRSTESPCSKYTKSLPFLGSSTQSGPGRATSLERKTRRKEPTTSPRLQSLDMRELTPVSWVMVEVCPLYYASFKLSTDCFILLPFPFQSLSRSVAVPARRCSRARGQAPIEAR